MQRIYEPLAYSDEGRAGCYWDSTVTPVTDPPLQGDLRADVAVIGAGFAGLNAALELRQSGADVVVLDSGYAGWGASGRNGGFCCEGGAKAKDSTLRRQYGANVLADWDAAQTASINHVDGLLSRYGIDVDRHSQGEMLLAHSPRALEKMHRSGATVISREALAAQGIKGPEFLGGVHGPRGFALNPSKYIDGLAQACRAAGVRFAFGTTVGALQRLGSGWYLTHSMGSVSADQVLVATNGYSSDDLPDWLRARYLPVLSSIMVTRVLTPVELHAQGWTSDLMSYDSRTLLHYFRLLPEGRFLFGMRGGLASTPQAEAATRARLRANFNRMFPAWAAVEASHMWSGLVCIMGDLVPFAGEVPGQNGLYAALGWHGNGVAMGSYAGKIVCQQMAGAKVTDPWPEFMGRPSRRFPLGKQRRMLMHLAYLAYGLGDRM